MRRLETSKVLRNLQGRFGCAVRSGGRAYSVAKQRMAQPYGGQHCSRPLQVSVEVLQTPLRHRDTLQVPIAAFGSTIVMTPPWQSLSEAHCAHLPALQTWNFSQALVWTQVWVSVLHESTVQSLPSSQSPAPWHSMQPPTRGSHIWSMHSESSGVFLQPFEPHSSRVQAMPSSHSLWSQQAAQPVDIQHLLPLPQPSN